MRESRWFCLASIVCVTATAMFSQATTATMQGVVRDPGGAVVPGAAITVTRIATRISSKWISGSEGRFIAPFLQPGEYEVSAEKAGFKKTVRKGIVLLVADTTRVDLTLEIGLTGDTVTGTAEAPLVQPDTSSLGQVLQSQMIDELPLNSPTGRNFTALMTLVPGAIRTNPAGLFDAPQGNASFSINGQRDGANNYMIDGADNNEVLLGVVTTLPPPEAVDEFKIQTSAFSAEFGRAGGAVIHVTTRAGTNELHGSIYEFLRNSALDARGPFDRGELPPVQQNDFGATLGGPVKRNRTFVFAGYSGFHQRAGQSLIASVPTLNQRSGVYLASEGVGAVYDPNAGAPFPGNTMPAARQSPVGRRILELYPAPNVAGRVAAGTGTASNYNGVVVQQQDVARGDIRFDHLLNARNSLFARYSIFDGFTALPPLFGAQAMGDTPARAGKGDSRNQSMVVGDVHVFSGGRINEFRASYARIAYSLVSYDSGQSLAAEIGIPNINVFGPTSSGLPRIDITGMNSLGADAPLPALRYENSFQWVDNFTLIHGRHVWKFGADVRRLRGDFLQISLESPRGHFLFDPNYTSNNGAAGTGLGAASVLLGFPASAARGVINMFPSNRITQGFLFVQDDFKVSQRLTVNLGIRYEQYRPAVDRWDNQANFDLHTGRMVLAARGGNSRALVHPDNNNWAPRIGFAFALQPRTAIRGGYGISYYPDKFGASGGTLNNSYPFISIQQVTPPDRFRPTPTLSIANGIELPTPADLAGESIPLVGAATYFDPNYKIGYVQFWNLGVQHQLTWNLAAEVAYVGTRGTHLFGNNHVNLNQPDPGPGAINNRRPYAGVAPLATAISLRDSSQWSFYRGLQVKVQKRMRERFWLLGTYTWATAVDNAAASYDTHDWDAVAEGPANTDFRHLTTLSSLYELPFGKGRRYFSRVHPVLEAIAGGWQVNGMYAFRTGAPATATLSAGLVATTVNTGGAGRPDQVDTARLPRGKRTLAQYFNVAAFVAPAVNSFRYGTATRNSIRGPSYWSLDLSLFKNVHFRERLKLQIRGEVFNLPNHPNLGQPGTSFGTTTFGAITSLAATSTMRQVQLGLKLLF